MPRFVYRWPIIIGVTALAVIAGLFFLVYTCINPSDEVDLTFFQVPNDVDSLFIVYESDNNAHAMKWYNHQLAWISSGKGTGAKEHDGSAGPSDVESYGPVQWQSSDRYGVVTHRRDRTWKIAWFAADATPVQGRNLLGRGGRVMFDLSHAEFVPLKDEDAEALLK
jgi:hypothetical protein